MEKLQKDPKVRLLINVLYYGVILALIYVGIKYALPVVMPFVLAFLIVLLLRGQARRLSARTKLPARWLRLLFLVAFYVVLFGLIVLFGAKLISWLGDFIQQMPTFYQNTIRPAIEAISGWVESVVGQFDPSLVASIDNAFEAMSSSLGTAVSSFSSSAVGVVTNFLAGMPGAIVNVVLMVVSSFYLASDYERVTGPIVRHLPEKWRNLLFEVKRKLKQSFGSYLKSYSLIFVMTWGELLVGLLLLRIPFAPLIALLIAICDILPVLGARDGADSLGGDCGDFGALSPGHRSGHPLSGHHRRPEYGRTQTGGQDDRPAPASDAAGYDCGRPALWHSGAVRRSGDTVHSGAVSPQQTGGAGWGGPRPPEEGRPMEQL